MRSALLPLLIGLVVLGLASPRAQAADDEVVLTQGVELTPVSTPADPDELSLEQTFGDVLGFIDTHDPIHIPLTDVAGLEAVSLDTVTISIANAKHAIAIRGDGTLLGKPISALLTADWNEANSGDTAPRLVLGVKFTDAELSDLNSAWTDLGDGVSPTFSRAWVSFSNTTGLLDVSKLPDVATDFYELTATPTYTLYAGANFRGFLDLNLYPALRKAIAFHGVKTQEILIEGHLAASAALLFGSAGAADLGELDLSTTIDATGVTPPAWLTHRDLTIGLRLDPGPVLEFGDVVDTLVGGAANQFSQTIAFDPADFAGSGPIEISGTFALTSALQEPFGVDIGNPSLELTVEIDLGAPSVITSIDAALLTDLDVGIGTVGARVELVVAGGNVSAHVILDNDVSLGDVVNAFAGAVDLPSFDTSSFGDLTLDTVTFDIARIGGNTSVSLAASLGAWNNVFGLNWLDLTDLTVGLTLADGELGGAAFPEPRLTASLGTIFDIGGIDSTLTVDVSGVEGSLAAKVRAGLAPGQVVPIGAAFDFVSDQFGSIPNVGAVLSDIDLDALSMVVSVDTAGAAAFDIFATVDVPDFPGASLYLSVANPAGTLAFFAGIRPDGPVQVGDIIAIPGIEDVQLPDVGLVLATAPRDIVAASLSAEGFAFLKPLFGCAPGDTQPGTGGHECAFDADLDAGVNMLANIAIPDAIYPVGSALWMDTNAGLQFLGTVPVDLGGDPPTAFSLRMVLPDVNPPDKVDFLESGRLSIGVEIDPTNLSVTLEVRGELQTRWRRSTDPVSAGASCSLGTNMAGIDMVGDTEVTHHYCYDRLTFDVSSAITLSPTQVALNLTGRVRATDGLWEQPFGVSWLDVRTLTLQFTVSYDVPGAMLNFEAGFLGDVVVNDKTIATSLAVGLTITPFPPPPSPAPAAVITPTFLGFRGYVSSLGMADVAELQRMFTGGSQALAFDSLPDIEIRNAEVMFAIKAKPELCLELGLGVAGEVFIDGAPADPIEVPTDENGCRPFGSLIHPETCQATGTFGRREEGCFASFFGRLSPAGIIADGSVGALDLGPVHFDDARLNFRLTPLVQAFVLSGGVTVDVLGSGEMAVSVKAQAPQLSFYGRLEVFDRNEFFAQVDGTLSISLAPPFHPDGHVVFHAALEADGFNDKLEGKVEDALEDIHDTVEPVLTFWNDLTGGSPGSALADIDPTLTALGVGVPEWADPLHDAAINARDLVNDAIDAWNLAGHSVDHVHVADLDIGVLIDGGTIKIDVGSSKLGCGVGQYRSGNSCYWDVTGDYAGSADPYCDFPASLNHDEDRCHLSIDIPSFSDFLDGIGLGDIDIPSSFSDAKTEVENLIEDGLRDVAGLSGDFDIDTYFTKLIDGLSDVSLLSIDCADFRFEAGSDEGTLVQLKLAMELLDQDYGLAHSWEFGGGGFSSLDGLLGTLLDQFFGTAQAVTCEGPAELPIEITAASEDAAVTLELTANPSAIDEGDEVTVTGTFSEPLADATNVQLRWRDGSTTTVTATGKTFQASHTYADDRARSAPDVYTVQAFIAGLEAASVDVIVNNVAPTLTRATVDGIENALIVEGTAESFTIHFSDPGVLDRHTVRITWGDGTPQTVRNLAAGVTSTVVTHLYVDNSPEGTASGPYPVTLTVTDDDGGSVSRTMDATVHNVAPSGLTASVVPQAIVESGTAVVTGSFADPGVVDQHTITIDWGHSSVPPTTIVLPVGARAYGASADYGDNGTFTITVRVDDGDTGIASTQRQLTVSNVVPFLAIDETGAIDVNSSPTFIVRVGSPATLPGRAADPGSDDLTFRWDFDTRVPSVDVSFTSLVPGQGGPDLFVSPDVHPRLGDDAATDARLKTYTEACVYQVGLTVVDDDGGTARDTTNVVVQGLDLLHRSPGYWYNQYKKTSAVLPTSVRTCYLLIAQYMSRIFGSGSDGDPISLSTFAKAAAILNADKSPRDKLYRQILTSWLDFANGSFTYLGLLDTNGDGVPDTTFAAMIRTAESVALNPSATSAQLLAQKDILARFNL